MAPNIALQKAFHDAWPAHAGIYVQWPSARLDVQLKHLREQASGTPGIMPDWEPCLVLPSGEPPMYRYHIQYPDGQVYFSQSHELKNHLNVYVSISARSLWTKGVATSVFVVQATH